MFRSLDFELGRPDSRDHAKAREIGRPGRIENMSQNVARGDGDSFSHVKVIGHMVCLFGPRVTRKLRGTLIPM